MCSQAIKPAPEFRPVYVVEDDPGVRASLDFLLQELGYSPLGFARGEELLARLPDLTPGCLLLDVGLPDVSGLELLESVRAAGCPFPVVMTSGLDSVPLVIQAFSAGVVTFLPKPLDTSELAEALAEGFDQLPERLTVQSAVTAIGALSPRERQVFEATCDGRTSPEVADLLGISERTVEAYRRAIHEKLRAPGIADLVKLRHLARNAEGDRPRLTS